MKIAAFSIADYCEATEGMPHDVERLYFRMIMKMLSRESGLPDDDQCNARIFGYEDVRTYKTLKSKLLKWHNTIYISDGLLMNDRVENDLRQVCARRVNAAESRKINNRSDGDQVEIGARSDGDQAEIDPRSQAEVGSIPCATHNENSTLLTPLSSPSPSPSPEEKEEEKLASLEQDAGGGGLAGLNGSSQKMISDICGWMHHGDERCAKTWLGTTISTFGPEITKRSYQRLATELAEGKPIASPLRAWSSIAQRMQSQPDVARRAPKGTRAMAVLENMRHLEVAQ